MSLKSVAPLLGDNLDGTEDPYHSEAPNETVDDTILRQQEVIDVLRRTLDDTSVVSGPTLRPVLEREVARRQIEVDCSRRSVLTRSRSVIVSPSTSTPNLSLLSVPKPRTFFGSLNNLEILNPPSSEPIKTQLFEIYQD